MKICVLKIQKFVSWGAYRNGGRDVQLLHDEKSEKMKKKAGRAVQAMGDLIDDVKYMFK